jgi:DNA-binding YbaB/EbfC family protein
MAMNMQQMMKQAQKMQQQLADAQDQLAQTEITASAGGGMVRLTGTADGQVTSVAIDAATLDLDPDDAEMLADTILAAFNDLQDQAQGMASQRLGAITGGMGMPGMPGLF